MIKKHKAKSHIAWLCLFAIVSTLFSPLQPTRVQAMEKIDGAGFIESEGEYLAEQGWTNSDKIELAVELITSGGTANFFLAFIGTRYIIHLFFINVVKPIEVWLHMVQVWRYDTGLAAVEEFRMMTLMLMDKRLDLAWFQAFCSELSVRQGWDHVYPKPWAFIHDEIRYDELDGFAPIGTGSSTPSQNASARGQSSAIQGAPIDLGDEFRGMMDAIDSFAFEKWVNEGANKGLLKKSFGIPKGVTVLNLRYDGGWHGPDGFMIDKQTGKCYLLEMKWHKSGGGTLGKIKLTSSLEIIQTSPEWLQKALLKVRSQDPARFAALVADAGDTNFRSLLLSVEEVYHHLGSGPLDPKVFKRISNFVNPDEIIQILRGRGYTDVDIEKLGDFWAKDYHVRVANRRGFKPTYIDDVGIAIKVFARKFLSRVIPGSGKTGWAGVKGG